MKHEVSVERLKDFNPCEICGSSVPIVEAFYRGLRGEWLFIVKCEFCGEFEPFKVVFLSDSNIDNKAIDTWNKNHGRVNS